MDYSVLMSVYHKENPGFLKLSIESMLNQTVPPSEFLIVKDGPLTDELDGVIAEYISAYPGLFTILVNEKNLGLGPSLAKGVLSSKNELIARMDSDDYCVPDRCEKQLRVFAADNSLGIVGSFGAEFSDSINHVVSIHSVPETDSEIRHFMRRRCAFIHPTVMYRKSAVIESENYQSVPLYEDYDMFARMVCKHNIKAYNVQESLYYVRVSDAFFLRRGGVEYAKTVLRFKWGMMKQGYMSPMDFFISGIGQAAVSLAPNRVRTFFYKKLLRE